MKKHWIINTTLVFVLLCLWANWVLGQTFPEEPAMQLGKGTIYDIAYSPDGKLLAVSGSLGVWLYETKNLTEIGLLRGHKSLVYGIAFSPDGRTLASLGISEIFLWDIEERKQKGHIEGEFTVAFSVDGKLLASGRSILGKTEKIFLWDVQTGDQVGVLKGHTDRVHSVAFSPDGKTLASGSEDKTVRLWDLQTQRQIGVLDQHTDWVYFVTFSPNANLLASIDNRDRAVHLWDVQRRELVSKLPNQGSRTKIAFSPDGKLVALEGELDTISLWDVQRQEQVAEIPLGEDHGSLRKLIFNPDGKTFASWGQDRIVRIWDVGTHKQVGLIDGYAAGIDHVFLNPEGTRVFAENQIWDVGTQKPIGSVPGVVKALSPDGSLLVLNFLRVWDVQAQRETVDFRSDSRAAVFSPDSKLLAAGGDNKIILIWDVEQKKLVARLRGHTQTVRALAFSPDGTLLASGAGDAIRLWNIPDQKQVTALEKESGAVTFSPDGTLLASVRRDEINLWDVHTKEQVGTLRFPISSPLNTCIAFSPDGNWLAGAGDGVQLWNVAKREKVATLRGHTGWIRSVSFSQNGKWLASGSRDGTVLLWEVNLPSALSVEPSGERIITLGRLKRAMLYQNYPNPFNPETWIPFQLAEAAHVRIQIYDVAGHLVRTLDLGTKLASSYLSREGAAYWDGRNDMGESVSSGVYFYTLEAGDYRRTRRMTVVR